MSKRTPVAEGHGSLEWVNYLISGVEPSRGQLTEFIQKLQADLRSGDFSLIGHALSTQIDVAKCAPAWLVAILRTSYVARRRIEEWSAFRERVAADLTKRGMNAEALLQGLSN